MPSVSPPQKSLNFTLPHDCGHLCNKTFVQTTRTTNTAHNTVYTTSTKLRVLVPLIIAYRSRHSMRSVHITEFAQRTFTKYLYVMLVCTGTIIQIVRDAGMHKCYVLRQHYRYLRTRIPSTVVCFVSSAIIYTYSCRMHIYI